MPKILPKKSCLLGLEMLTLSLDHNNEALATLISCLLNRCPNLKNLKIIVSPKQLMFIQFFFLPAAAPKMLLCCVIRKGAAHDDRWESPAPLAAEFWEEQINGDRVLNHLSSITIYVDSLFENYPCLGLCQFLVMNARILKRMSIHYYHWQLKMGQVVLVEAVRNEVQLWPRANPNVLLELSPVDRHPNY